MLKIIRILINPIIDKNLEILNLLSRIRYYMGFPFYLYSLKFNKEYLGGYLFSDQEAGRERQKIIRKVVKKIDKNFIKILEVGVYCGQTTLSLSKELIKNNKDFEITCLDIWDEFEITSNKDSFIHNKMIEVLKNSLVYNLFIHNLKVNNILTKCRIVKKKSSNYLKNNNEKFDLIIIDASHLYREVFEDLENSKKIINDNGFLVGDDYEIKFSNISNVDLNELCNQRLDIYYDNYKKIKFHPGVTMAVYKSFGDLNSINGLFCIQNKNQNFTDYSEELQNHSK